MICQSFLSQGKTLESLSGSSRSRSEYKCQIRHWRRLWRKEGFWDLYVFFVGEWENCIANALIDFEPIKGFESRWNMGESMYGSNAICSTFTKHVLSERSWSTATGLTIHYIDREDEVTKHCCGLLHGRANRLGQCSYFAAVSSTFLNVFDVEKRDC